MDFFNHLGDLNEYCNKKEIVITPNVYDKGRNISIKISSFGENILTIEDAFTDANKLVKKICLDVEKKFNNFLNKRGVYRKKTEIENEINFGRYKALIIGVSDYTHNSIQSLQYPVEDANKFESLLENEYEFDEIKILRNPTKDEIFDEFDIIETELNEGDNLLIFYAGHSFREKNKKSSWLPSDAEKERRRRWVENSSIKSYLERFQKCQHILLIDDSCFSGSWLETRNINFKGNDPINSSLYYSKSRTVITSGAKNEEVSDNSEFFNQIYKILKENKETYINLLSQFDLIQKKVILDNPLQKPQMGKLPIKEDDGGSFIFFKKD